MELFDTLVTKIGAVIDNVNLPKFGVVEVTIQKGHYRDIVVSPKSFVTSDSGTISVTSGSQDDDGSYNGIIRIAASSTSDSKFYFSEKYGFTKFGFHDNISWDKSYMSFDLSQLSACINMKELFLISTQLGKISNFNLETISNLVNLERIEAHFSTLNGASDVFKSLNKLTYISLIGSTISGSLINFGYCKQLETLNLQNVLSLNGSIESFAQHQVNLGRREGTCAITGNGIITYEGTAFRDTKTITYTNDGYTIA